jgi:hypothetical protein
VSAPCVGCGTKRRERSACPLCGKVYCQPCAERPYEFCCELPAFDDPRQPDALADALAEVLP